MNKEEKVIINPQEIRRILDEELVSVNDPGELLIRIDKLLGGKE